MIMIILIIIQFSSLVLKCTVSCTNVNYKASITTQIEHKKYKYTIIIKFTPLLPFEDFTSKKKIKKEDKVDKEKNQCVRQNGSTEHTKRNKTIPEKVATTFTENGHKHFYQNKHYNINQKDEGTYDDRGRDGGTNFILRIKEQETRLTLQKHDDDEKVHSITGHEGTAVWQKYDASLSLSSALDGGLWSTPRSGRFTSGNDLVHII